MKTEFIVKVSENTTFDKNLIKGFEYMDEYIKLFKELGNDNDVNIPDTNVYYAKIYEMLKYAATLGGSIINVEIKDGYSHFYIKFTYINDYIEFCSDLPLTMQKKVGFY